MSTIDLGATQSPLSRTNSPRANAYPVRTPAVQEIDSGDFYIGSTKISALPAHNPAQAPRLTSSN